jgi:hypothetical protein
MIRSKFLRGTTTFAVAFTLTVLSGCGYGSSDRVPVQGKVTFDGQPVDNGIISFIPEGGSGGKSGHPQVNADIVGGNYKLESGKGPMPGKYRVEILWKKKTGRQVPTPGDETALMDETQQVLPPQYNTQSTLTADIEAKSNTKDFPLTSK